MSNTLSKSHPKLTFKDVLTSSGRYPDREKHPECTYEVILNAQKTIAQVNKLLDRIGAFHRNAAPSISSGFRPSDVNAATQKAATCSAHLTGEAVDLVDKDGYISKCIRASGTDLLTQYDLYMEDESSTPGWCHLTIRPPKSGKRIFKP